MGCGSGVDTSNIVVYAIKRFSGALKRSSWSSADPVPDEPRKYKKEVVGVLLGYWMEKAVAKAGGHDFDKEFNGGWSTHLNMKEGIGIILKDSREKLTGLGKIDAEITMDEIGEHLPIRYNYVKATENEGKIEITHPAAPEWAMKFSDVHGLLAETERVFLQEHENAKKEAEKRKPRQSA